MKHRSLRLPAGLAVVAATLTATLTACATTAPGGSTAGSSGGAHTIRVAASINAWGSILSQLGGTHVSATSIITNPDTDPHDYEPTPRDATVVAQSQLFVENGIGYDSWAAKSLAANPDGSRLVVDVGDLVHVPDGGNPHRWYSPADVATVADAITADLKKLDPADADYFDEQHRAFVGDDLATYHSLITRIRAGYTGTAVGASESIFSPLADALGLDLVTPASFLQAVSEGTDPSARDLSTIATQIRERRIKIYVYNSQNATPDVAVQVRAAKAAGIPVATVTETLSPAGASFEQWQSAQLRALLAALQKASG